MKCFSLRLGLATRLLALSVSFAVVVSSYAFAFAAPTKTARNTPRLNASQADSANSALKLTSASASATKAGVLLRWSTNSVPDNIGFNIYRLKDGQRTPVNKEIIPGALFATGTPALMRAGYSYAWFDRDGTAAATYFIESVSVDGSAKVHDTIRPVSTSVSEFEPGANASGGRASAPESTDTFEKRYPAQESSLPSGFGGTAIQDQWAIAAQTALKIGIKKDGWYRVTQPEMVIAGFNSIVDIRNLRLFVDANEVAISTNQSSGQFSSGDYIEFYGRGLDVPTTDKRAYYLIAGTTPGKRVGGDIQLDGDPGPTPFPTPTPISVGPPDPTPTRAPITLDLPPVPTPTEERIVPLLEPSRFVLRDPVFYSWAQNNLDALIASLQARNTSDNREGKEREAPKAINSSPVSLGSDSPAVYAPEASAVYSPPAAVAEQPTSVNSSSLVNTPAPTVVTQPAMKTARQLRKQPRTRKRARRTFRRQTKQENSHAAVADGFAPSNYAFTIETKDRLLYLSNLLNGDEENFFGNVISSAPVIKTLAVSNPDLTATGPATLLFALQGVMSQAGNEHDVSVSLNNVTIGSVHFFPLDHPVRTFSIPMAQVLNGNNNLKFTKTSTGEVCLIDYIRFTYPHTFSADLDNSVKKLKFNLRGSQSRKVDGFATPLVRLINYTDPLNVTVTRPAAESSVNGYAITVPMSESRSKAQRLLYAIPQGQFDQAAALTLSTPSTLNLTTNAADLVIISHKNFIPSFTANVTPINTSFVAQRLSQGLTVSIVDIDDVYDEFSYGVHGPQAIRDFLQHASTLWTTPPRYIIFAGDASLDPRNYQNIGDFDFVPTKLVDATYNETASDDWLADFDDDGIANIPIGRIPSRSLADTNLIVSKIVNFSPLPQPQKAMLVADEDEFNIFGFAQTNDVFQSLLPAGMNVQRLNRAPQPTGVPSQPLVKADIVNGFNAGPALVNYSGHGNVDVWTGAALFTASDALVLTNGNQLSFVVVMDCLNGYFQDATLLSLSEAWMKAPNGGAVAAFASSGLTFAQPQHDMGHELYTQLYGGSPMALGDAIKIAKGATLDIDVRRTWIFFGDPSLKIRQ